MAEQCKHSRTTGVLSSRRCTRDAVKDGYCTRHHPDYVSPQTKAALDKTDEGGRAQPIDGHKRGTVGVTVGCQCGWRSASHMGKGAMKNANAEWRWHTQQHHSN